MSHEIAFRLPSPAYEQYTWDLQGEHCPLPQAPLLIFDNPPIDSSHHIPRSLLIHGFRYLRRGGVPAHLQQRSTNSTTLPTVLSVAQMRRWRIDWLPKVDKLVQLLEHFDPASVAPGQWKRVLRHHDVMYGYVFSGIHTNAQNLGQQAFFAFARDFEKRFGSERTQDMHALVQGVKNCSLDRAAALWDLGRILRANVELQAALNRGISLSDCPSPDAFNDAFASMIAIYGHTSNNDLQDLPVWGEDHGIPLAIIRAYARQDDVASPRAAAARQQQRRFELEAELRSLAARGDELVARILQLLPSAQELIPNSEDHNFLADQRQIAASRRRWMSIGRHLAERNAINSPDDIFFIKPCELPHVLEGDQIPDRGAIGERKLHLRITRASRPPPVLGKQSEARERIPSPSNAPTATGLRVIRGVAASSGSIRGRARLIETLEQAATLVDGDVLLVRSSTPSWTPFFTLASALIANSGGMLSHAAVIARELGIPAVVGTLNATAMIPDGAIVTVDGTGGMVIVEESLEKAF
jgi:phosphohistidine swiveling domain-containing protein